MERILPKRKSPRLQNFDYSSANYYFITICTHNRICLFGTAEENNQFGRIAEEGIHQISKHFTDVTVDIFNVMPNHVHMIIVLNENKRNLSSVIGSYKAFVSKEIHKMAPELSVWQRSFHDHIIRTQQSYEKIWIYVANNHRKWREDCFFSEEA